MWAEKVIKMVIKANYRPLGMGTTTPPPKKITTAPIYLDEAPVIFQRKVLWYLAVTDDFCLMAEGPISRPTTWGIM